MPVYRPSQELLRHAVTSVIAQTNQDWELLIVEDDSPEVGEDVIAGFADPRIRYARIAERRSLVESLNQGVDLARGEWIARMDADDVCEPDRLKKQLEFVREHPDVDVLGTQLAIIDASGQTRGWRRYPLEHSDIVRALRRYNAIAHPSVLFRKSPVLDSGGYRFPVNEDYELWCRLAKRGARFANHPEALLRYRLHPGALKAAQLRKILGATLEIKRLHFKDDLDLMDRARMLLERCLMLAPPALVLRLFTMTQYSSREPTTAAGGGQS